MLPPMTDPAAADTMPLVTFTEGDDGIPPDPLLQSETYINSETNARVETAKPNKADVVVEKGKVVDLATSVSVESESKMEVQMTELVAGTVMPMHKVNRSIEVNVARPSWLPEDWKFVTEVHIDGALAGTIHRVYRILQKYCILGESDTGAASKLKSLHNLFLPSPDPPIGLHSVE